MNNVRNTNLDKRAEIATKRQERDLLHADCVACGQAIGNWDDRWVHIGGVACEDAPWLNDDTERCVESGKMMEAYEDHLKVVAEGGRNDPDEYNTTPGYKWTGEPDRNLADCCPFHARWRNPHASSMPCGSDLWGEGFTIHVDGHIYDIWGVELQRDCP